MMTQQPEMTRPVLILTEGGGQRGLGHVTRCLSVLQALQEQGTATLIIVDGDETVELALNGTNHRRVEWLSEPHRTLEGIDPGSVVVIDSYLAPSEFYSAVSQRAHLGVFFDDTHRLEYPPGIVVNGALFAEEQDYPTSGEIQYLLGTRFTPLRKAFWEAPGPVHPDEIQTVLLTFGHDDGRELTPRVLRLLTDGAESRKWTKRVVVGSGYRNLDRIQSLDDGTVELIHGADDRDMIELMWTSDLAISAGGQTLYELARVGVPTIAVGAASNQRPNLDAWERAGFIHSAGYHDGPDLNQRLLRCIEALLAKSSREASSQAGRTLISGLGSRSIADQIRGSALN